MPKSYFQHLPEHIISQVVDYALQMYYGYTGLHGHVALSILHSSHSWRVAIIKKTCDELHVEYNPKYGCKHNITNWPQALDNPCFPFYHYIKHFKISTEWQYVTDSSALKWLRDSMTPGTRFTSAQSLEIHIQGMTRQIDVPAAMVPAAVKNVAEFIQTMRHMVPNNREIRINWAYPLFLQSDEDCALSFRNLVADMLKGMPVVSFIEKSRLMLSTELDPTSFRDLSCFTYVYCAAHTWFADVIQKSSPTLIELRLLMVPKAGINSLLFDDNDRPVVYTSLRLLDISHDDTSDYRYLDNQVTHFPAVKRFVLFGEYPFASSQPFSTPIFTLESMTISLFCFKSDCDKMTKALVSGQLQNLRTVYFYDIVHSTAPHLTERYRDNDALICPIEALLKSTNSIRNFKLVGERFDKDAILNMVTTLTAFKNIHNIHIGYCNLDFPNIVRVLASIPNLRYFCCGLASGFPEMNGYVQDELIQLIDDELGPLNTSLVTLDINNSDSMPVEFVVETVAMLVIGCPNLSQLVMELGDMYGFIDLMDEFAKGLPFPDHTSRLLGFTKNLYPQE